MRILSATGATALVVTLLTPVFLFAKVYSEPPASTEHSVCRPVLWDME